MTLLICIAFAFMLPPIGVPVLAVLVYHRLACEFGGKS